MKVSVEISLYPLRDDYEKVVLRFLTELNAYDNIEVETNGMSTQIFGAYDDVMAILKKEMKTVYESEQAVLVMKMGKGTLK